MNLLLTPKGLWLIAFTLGGNAPGKRKKISDPEGVVVMSGCKSRSLPHPFRVRSQFRAFLGRCPRLLTTTPSGLTETCCSLGALPQAINHNPLRVDGGKLMFRRRCHYFYPQV